jgi:hypothetical protein
VIVLLLSSVVRLLSWLQLAIRPLPDLFELPLLVVFPLQFALLLVQILRLLEPGSDDRDWVIACKSCSVGNVVVVVAG